MNSNLNNVEGRDLLLLLVAVLVYLTVSELFGYLITDTRILSLGTQSLDPYSPVSAFIAAFLAAMITTKYLLFVLLSFNVFFGAYALHILQRTGEHLPDPATHLELLAPNILGFILALVSIIIGIAAGKQAKSMYKKQ